MDFFGTYFTHAQTCNGTRVQSATEWTVAVHTLHMPGFGYEPKALRARTTIRNVEPFFFQGAKITGFAMNIMAFPFFLGVAVHHSQRASNNGNACTFCFCNVYFYGGRMNL